MRYSAEITSCRVCNGPFYETPLAVFENMPAQAQHFPKAHELADDRAQDLYVCQCQQCGLVQLTCAPVSYYREVVRAAAYSPQMKIFRQKQFQDFIQRHQLVGKKMLEIGCGGGEYLSLMAEQDIDVFGIEGGADNVAICLDHGLNVQQTFLEDVACELDHAPFDGFFMLNYLEHIPDPNTLLQALHTQLSTPAIGLIEVPNFDMILKTDLFSEFISDHLFYFTEKTLSHLLERNGFEVLSCQPVWHDYSLSVEVKKRTPLDLSRLLAKRDHLLEDFQAFFQEQNGKRIAIWGAGHQALALINLLNLAPSIAYVVDSAPFKQGTFTPASHLPIMAPAHLKEDPVHAVLVMAASYSDEVARILLTDYDPSLNIAVVRDHGLERLA